ncbi:hypothetical protein K439DRAFT_1376950 [Ramaria rubella]|nr:hypothetical protein K439DRAFT_1376950 [Ramaria rubella]
MQQEFAASIAVIWCVPAGIVGAGPVSCLIMKEIPMLDELDEAFALDGARGAIGEGAIGVGKHVGIDVRKAWMVHHMWCARHSRRSMSLLRNEDEHLVEVCITQSVLRCRQM